MKFATRSGIVSYVGKVVAPGDWDNIIRNVSVMQESIDRAVNWTHNNCMKINSKKSKEMVICFTPDEHFRNSIPSIVINNIVETVEYAKLLGVTLSNDLTWNRHVDCIVKKGCQKSVYVISVKESRH